MTRKGLVFVFTGDGKGKTTAALGLGLRAWGHGMRVLCLQFIKGAFPTGESAACRKLDGFELRSLGLGLIRDKSPGALAPHREAAREAFLEAEKAVKSPEWDVVILDEVFCALQLGLLSEEDLRRLIRERLSEQHLVLTGRDAPRTICDMADLVTDMKCVKHPYDHGVAAQPGIEF
ncbi:MAG: cob(I)yrinic acid a,c-diamide adenosyltransferase [Bacillota bacterium]|uniref:cob(I)yrinic acid a,c-diamide adenosyltransferase n=1 Tax=Desulforudis sp. DRI-14 TaxID=3459793 RepID=UPI00347B36D3